MKDLIRNILREQTTDLETDDIGRTQSGRDALDTKTDKFKQKLRLFFTYMTTVGGSGGCEELLEFYEENGPPSTYGTSPDPDNRLKMHQLQNRIEEGFKIIGMQWNTKFSRNKTHYILYALLVNYVHNGGSNRKFSEGEISLIPAKMYEIDVNVSETLTEWSSLYCDVFGGDKDKAIKQASERPYTFEVDRESHDHDYHGDMKVDSVGQTDVKEMTLTPDMFGI